MNLHIHRIHPPPSAPKPRQGVSKDAIQFVAQTKRFMPASTDPKGAVPPASRVLSCFQPPQVSSTPPPGGQRSSLPLRLRVPFDPAFSSISTMGPCPDMAANISAVHPSCTGGHRGTLGKQTRGHAATCRSSLWHLEVARRRWPEEMEMLGTAHWAQAQERLNNNNKQKLDCSHGEVVRDHRSNK